MDSFKGENHFIKIKNSDVKIQTRTFINNVENKSPYKEICCVLCHPHPQFGGTMQNNVVRGMRDQLIHTSIPCATFNFRGVGRSTGEYDHAIGEQDDLINVINYIREKFPKIKKIAIGSYSFGSVVALEAIKRIKDVLCLFMVAYPFGFVDSVEPDFNCKIPKQFIVGTRDNYGRYDLFFDIFERFVQPKSYKIIQNSDHFYIGHEKEIGTHCVQFIKDILKRENKENS